MPPKRSAPARLARAILALEKHPAPARLSEPTVEMLRRLAPHTSGPLGMVVGRAAALRRPLAEVFARLGPATAAMARTTYAITQLSGAPANNVLATPEDGARLAERGVLYAPDYVVNAGGIISVAAEHLGWSAAERARRVEQTGARLAAVLDYADEKGLPPNLAADRLAHERIGLAQAPDGKAAA